MSSSSKETAVISLGDYFDSLKIDFKDIESATNNFAHENLLARGTTFEVYKGQLLQGDDQFINIVTRQSPQFDIMANEVLISKTLKHKNIVSAFKFSVYEDSDQLFIINKHEANGSLEKHLSSPTLTWMQRLHICVGVARALKYLHCDAKENHCVIHGNIKTSKILLDHNWEPKLYGFGFAVKAQKHHPHRISKYNGSLQYMDPAYENTRCLTHKSDVFSFGVLLCEVLFGREAFIQNNDDWYFARLARSHYEELKLDDLIHPDLRNQMDSESFNIFAETAYCCLKEQRSQRPDMNQVLSRLEKTLELQHKHEHPESTSSDHLRVILHGKSLNHLKLQLIDIKLATNNFSDTCCIGSGGFGKVYKAELEHFDDNKLLVVEGKNRGLVPKKRSTVAIKRIFCGVDRQGEKGFLAEIELLSKCRHPNIVSLLGFCDEGSEMILVYEYVYNGSLDDYLGNTNNLINLTWAQRIQICLDIARGLNYLHTGTEDKQPIIHRDIKSANILLDENWVAKIADFGLSKLHLAYQQRSTLVTCHIAGTEVYLDPEYLITGNLKAESDIYSFGVVLSEILGGKLAYDETYNEKALPSIVRQCFKEGTWKKLIDPKINEADEITSMLAGAVDQDSLDTFLKIAYHCLEETQSKRPPMKVIIEELEKAFNFEKIKNNLKISLEAVKLGTQDFSVCNCIGESKFWKLYEGEIACANRCTPIVVKRWDRKIDQGPGLFLTELDFLWKYKHENIISFAGYCNEIDENIIVYEHATNGRLDKHLCDPSLTWVKRLKICIDVANGLEFLHKNWIKHRGIKSGSILLDGDWNAKISNLEQSCEKYFCNRAEHVDDNDCNSLGYVDPGYENVFREAHDIYSLGVILIEVLCGRLAWEEGCEYHHESLGPLAFEHYYEKGNLDEMVFKGVKEQITPQSLITFEKIAICCLDEFDKQLRFSEYYARPKASDVVLKLKKALKYQEDYEIWAPKLPIDYKDIIEISNTPNFYNCVKMKKDLYDEFSKGILLADSKTLLSLGGNGEINEMMSARMFSFKKCMSHKWRSVLDSRFGKAAKINDISNLNIGINIKTRFLIPGVNYGAYIIFKFCDARKFTIKPMYVNLTFKKDGQKLQSYFATWRDDKWMMVELCRFLCHKKDITFEVLLESFSRYYCGNSSIYVEGIEFRAIDSKKNEEIGETLQLLESNSNKDQLSSLNEVGGKKPLMLSVMDFFYRSSYFSPCHLQPSAESRFAFKTNLVTHTYNFTVMYHHTCRFEELIELLPKQVFPINCKLESQMLSQDTEYFCYLVFTLSEKCPGLHCPVKVRDLLNRNNKDAEVVYFRSPSPWNLHENNSVPEQREDGWMEVKVWEFNSNHQLRHGCIPVNLKLITYEGTMSGLILGGLEFRPM